MSGSQYVDAANNAMQYLKYYSYNVLDSPRLLQYWGVDRSVDNYGRPTISNGQWTFRVIVDKNTQLHVHHIDENSDTTSGTLIHVDPRNIPLGGPRPILIDDIYASDEEEPESEPSDPDSESSVRSNSRSSSSSSSDQPLFLSKTPYGDSNLYRDPNPGYVPFPSSPPRSRHRGRPRNRRTSRDRPTSSSRSRSRDRPTSINNIYNRYQTFYLYKSRDARFVQVNG
jgi:hypothetical protein